MLHVYGFNFTGLDIDRSRSFGVIDEEPEAGAGSRPAVRGRRRPSALRALVRSARSSARRPRASGSPSFIKGARRQLLIYDPQVSDAAMVRLLTERAAKGVDVRIIGKLAAKKAPLTAEKYPGKRLHVRAIVRDGRHAFVGSQSLRKIELEKRREVGVIASEPGVVKQIQSVFEQDWALTRDGEEGRPQSREGGKKSAKETGRTVAANGSCSDSP